MDREPLKVCVLGPSGRMGQLVAASVAAAADLELVGLADDPSSDVVGELLHGVEVKSDPAAALADADVYIDFTVPAATAAAARAAADLGVAAVIGTTGLGERELAALAALERSAPVLVASNFSLGVNLLAALTETAARALGSDYDVELVELHHRRKRDAPSGTALTLAEAVARGRGQSLADVARYQRHGDIGPRAANEIGIQSVRGGDIVGEHTVYLISDSERIELSHRAADRRLFASGAIAAARWLCGKPPGRYQMRDVLGL